jgi:hypothetical protein
MTLCAQELKTPCALEADAADICAKLKAMAKLTAIYLSTLNSSHGFTTSTTNMGI